MRRRLAVIAAVAAVLVLAGCGAENVPNPSDGLSAADGQYSEWKPAERAEPVSFDTTLEDGSAVSSASLAGKVVVVNFWYAGCPPCRVEAPVLQAVHEAYPQVEFVGVNTRDAAAEADAFDKSYGVTYPSILDASDGDMLLAFAKVKPANATPTTLILDQQGRVAARVLGQVQTAQILSDLLDTVISESNG